MFNMGNPQRLHLLIILSEGEASVNFLAEKVGLSQSALSQHLARLRKGKLVKTRRDAQKIYYSCASPAVLELLAVLTDIYSTPTEELAVAS
jgi:ArsR family transcriptional regulator, virulence genes transcriptional regulator